MYMYEEYNIICTDRNRFVWVMSDDAAMTKNAFRDIIDECTVDR